MAERLVVEETVVTEETEKVRVAVAEAQFQISVHKPDATYEHEVTVLTSSEAQVHQKESLDRWLILTWWNWKGYFSLAEERREVRREETSHVESRVESEQVMEIQLDMSKPQNVYEHEVTVKTLFSFYSSSHYILSQNCYPRVSEYLTTITLRCSSQRNPRPPLDCWN